MKALGILLSILAVLILLAGCAHLGEVTQPAPVSSVTQPVNSVSPSFLPSSVINPTTPEAAIPGVTMPVAGIIEPVGRPFPGTVILGRPTDDAITLSLLASLNVDLYIEYRKIPGKYDAKTALSSVVKDQPLELKITGLEKNTQYYYRICHRGTDEVNYSAGVESSFRTQRDLGETFVFTVDADPHFDSNTDSEKVTQTFLNILNEHPDFNIDLGDTFMTEKLAVRSYSQAAGIYIDKLSYFNLFAHSVPLFLAIGNHDGESGGSANKVENSVAVWSSQSREFYYPNPSPDAFYSGNSQSEPFVGLRENYYSWQWGDALYIVLDPYWYAASSKDLSGWNVTLGRAQYDWLKATLENSTAKFKFIFAHSLVGGFDLGAAGNMRGGIEAAGFYEWGGENTDGTWGFDTNRPGWGEPIHQLLVDNNVTIFFHGHDHFFAQQELDGVIYQECPQPGAVNEKLNPAQYGYVDGVFFSSPGHVRVTVSNDTVIVDYIKTYLPGKEPAGHQNGEIAYSYTIKN